MAGNRTPDKPPLEISPLATLREPRAASSRRFRAPPLSGRPPLGIDDEKTVPYLFSVRNMFSFGFWAIYPLWACTSRMGYKDGMPRKGFPFREYLGPSIALVASAAWFAAQQFLQFEPWWQKVPWGLITLGLIIFIAGNLYADLWNKDSQLRRWWRSKRCNFTIVAVSTNHTWDDAQRQGTERIEIWCLIRFLKRIDNPLLAVRVTSPLEIAEERRTTTLVINERLGEVLKDSEKRIILGTVGISRPVSHADQETARNQGRTLTPQPSKWGDNGSMIPGSKNLIEVSIDDHSYKIFAQIIAENREDMQRVFLLTEDEKTAL